MCWLILGGLEVLWVTFRWVFWWLKAHCHILLYAASSVTKKALREGQDVNFFDFFWCFPNYCIKMNGKMPRERGKVTKLVFWATLMHILTINIWSICGKKMNSWRWSLLGEKSHQRDGLPCILSYVTSAVWRNFCCGFCPAKTDFLFDL